MYIYIKQLGVASGVHTPAASFEDRPAPDLPARWLTNCVDRHNANQVVGEIILAHYELAVHLLSVHLMLLEQVHRRRQLWWCRPHLLAGRLIRRFHFPLEQVLRRRQLWWCKLPLLGRCVERLRNLERNDPWCQQLDIRLHSHCCPLHVLSAADD